MSWLVTLDHKRIGVMYLISVTDRLRDSAASSRCSCAPSSSRAARPCSTRTPTTRCSRCTASSWCSSSSSRRSRRRWATSSCRSSSARRTWRSRELNLAQLLHLLVRRALRPLLDDQRRRRHGLDVLHALQLERPGPRRRRHGHVGHPDDARRVHHGVLVDPHRA